MEPIATRELWWYASQDADATMKEIPDEPPTEVPPLEEPEPGAPPTEVPYTPEQPPDESPTEIPSPKEPPPSVPPEVGQGG